jgi:TonB-dependent starch-binding outer membrane protein SusC
MEFRLPHWQDIGKHIISCSILLLLTCVCSNVQAQNLSLKGSVKDDTGLGLPGASIVVKGTSKGVVTDNDGNFALDASKGGILVVSYVGFDNQEVAVNDNTPSVLQ